MRAVEHALAATRAAVEEGIVPGGGTALIAASKAVAKLVSKNSGDVKTGVSIVLRALEEPVRQIAKNAGVEGSVIVEKVKASSKVGYGYDAAKDEYCDMIKRGIIDPTKVTRSALQNAASVAAMVLTTESLVADLPDKNPPCCSGSRGRAWAVCINRLKRQTQITNPRRPIKRTAGIFFDSRTVLKSARSTGDYEMPHRPMIDAAPQKNRPGSKRSAAFHRFVTSNGSTAQTRFHRRPQRPSVQSRGTYRAPSRRRYPCGRSARRDRNRRRACRRYIPAPF